MNCHMCGSETEYTCRDCNEPVCEDCCVPFTLQNQIDYTLCRCCHDGNQARAALYYWKKEKEEEEEKKIKDEKCNKARIAAQKRYWLPKNIEKRRQHKIEQVRLRQAQFIKAMEIVGNWFK